MSNIDWTSLLAPAVAALVTTLVAAVLAVVSGLVKRLNAYLVSHNQASLAAAIASANAVIQPAITTSASVIAGKISSGQLDYSNRGAIVAEAQREVGLINERVPEMLAIAQPVAGALVASVMGKVDAMIVASPTIPSTPILNAPVPKVAVIQGQSKP